MVSGNGTEPAVRPTVRQQMAETPSVSVAFFDALDEALLKAEKQKLVAELTPAQLRNEVSALLDAYEAVLDYVDDLERQSVIAGELKRLRCRGEIRWVL